jgi:hypothetical protein
MIIEVNRLRSRFRLSKVEVKVQSSSKHEILNPKVLNEFVCDLKH